MKNSSFPLSDLVLSISQIHLTDQDQQSYQNTRSALLDAHARINRQFYLLTLKSLLDSSVHGIAIDLSYHHLLVNDENGERFNKQDRLTVEFLDGNSQTRTPNASLTDEQWRWISQCKNAVKELLDHRIPTKNFSSTKSHFFSHNWDQLCLFFMKPEEFANWQQALLSEHVEPQDALTLSLSKPPRV